MTLLRLNGFTSKRMETRLLGVCVSSSFLEEEIDPGPAATVKDVKNRTFASRLKPRIAPEMARCRGLYFLCLRL